MSFNTFVQRVLTVLFLLGAAALLVFAIAALGREVFGPSSCHESVELVTLWSDRRSCENGLASQVTHLPDGRILVRCLCHAPDGGR